MRAALADDNFLNGRATGWAGLACAVVNAEVILKISAAIDPIKAGSIVFDARHQDSLNGSVQTLNFAN